MILPARPCARREAVNARHPSSSSRDRARGARPWRARGAQVYPSRPVTLVVPYGPGGITDILARILAEGLRGPLGQPVIIENVPGASGTIGVGRVARAAPDGYTVSIGNWGTHVVNGAVQRLPYDLLNDLAPIAVCRAIPMKWWRIIRRRISNRNNMRTSLRGLRGRPKQPRSQGPGRARLLRFARNDEEWFFP
jgi:tripartite-type tricarboxylate transporter receptor subunit TctC